MLQNAQKENLLTFMFPLLVLFIIALFVNKHLRFRRCISRLLASNSSKTLNATTINTFLERINSESAELIVASERAITVFFRGRTILLVWGQASLPLTTHAGQLWRSRPCLFAIADVPQRKWMATHTEVFRLAFAGSTHSVFWVDAFAFESGINMPS